MALNNKPTGKQVVLICQVTGRRHSFGTYREAEAKKVQHKVKGWTEVDWAKHACSSSHGERGAAPSQADPSARTVRELFTEWLYDETNGLIHGTRLRHGTRSGYEFQARLHIIPHLGGRTVGSLTRQDLTRWLRQLVVSGRADGKGGLAESTVQYVWVTFGKCLREYEIPVPPVSSNDWKTPTSVSIDDPHQKGAAWPSRPEVERFLDWCATAHQKLAKRYALAYELSAATGLRAGEIVGLSWPNVDLDTGVIDVRQQLTLNQLTSPATVELSPVKRNRSKRTVKVDERLLKRLRQLRVEQAEARLKAGAQWVDPFEQDLVFRHAEQGVYEFGAAVSAKRFGKYFRDWWVQAIPEHPEVTLHGLRHFCASQLINEVGLSIPEVAAWLSDTETTVLRPTPTSRMTGTWTVLPPA